MEKKSFNKISYLWVSSCSLCVSVSMSVSVCVVIILFLSVSFCRSFSLFLISFPFKTFLSLFVFFLFVRHSTHLSLCASLYVRVCAFRRAVNQTQCQIKEIERKREKKRSKRKEKQQQQKRKHWIQRLNLHSRFGKKSNLCSCVHRIEEMEPKFILICVFLHLFRFFGWLSF